VVERGHRLGLLDVGGIAHERARDEVDAGAQAEREVDAIPR
jgi:hypothetical protein